MYSQIHSIYSKFLWPEFSQDLFRRLEIFLFEWKINTHFDIACGTGDFVYLVTKTGVNSSGGDVSQGMIKVARKKYPGLKFSQFDMRNFSLAKKVDFITCNFDSLNHLLKFNDWQKTFKNIFDNLEDNGRFVFDINTLYTINNSDREEKVQIDDSEMIIKIKSQGNDALLFDINCTILNGEKVSIKERVKEKSFEYSIIKKSLKQAGFKKVVVFNKNLGIKNTKTRLYILAQK